MTEIQVDIIQENQSEIYSQIEELVLTITTDAKTTIQEAIAQLIPMTILNQLINTELDNETELITHEYQPTNEDITNMELEKEQRKRKELHTQKVIEEPPISTPTRSSR